MYHIIFFTFQHTLFVIMDLTFGLQMLVEIPIPSVTNTTRLKTENSGILGNQITLRNKNVRKIVLLCA